MAETDLEQLAKFVGNLLMTNTNLSVEKVCDIEEYILTFKPEEKPELPLDEWEADLKKRVAGIKKDMELGRYRGGVVHEEISHLNPPKPEHHHIDPYPEVMRRMMEHHIDIPRGYGSMISGRYSRHKPPFHELYGSRTPMMILDDKEPNPCAEIVLDSIPREMTRHRSIDIESNPFLEHKTMSPRRSAMVYFDEAQYVKPSDMWLRDWPDKTERSDEPKEEPDWKRETFKSGPETPPSDAKRNQLRAKRKKRK